MNRLICENLAGVRPDLLPPAGPRRAGDPLRALFITSGILGFSISGRLLESYTAQRDAIDAVHVHLRTPLWMKVLGKSIPGLHGWDLHPYRHMLLWRAVLRRWLSGPLSLDRFDLVQITTQHNALVGPWIKRRSGARLALYIDATGACECRDFGYPRAVHAPLIGAERRIFAAADLVSCMSDWAGASVREDYGVPTERVSLLRPAIPLPTGSPAVRPAAPLAAIAFIGNDWRRKGGPRLLKWHQQRWSARAHLHVFSSRAPRDTTARNVTWHGPTARDRLLGELLPAMDLLVIPTWEDTLLLAALEAAGLGLPVVSSRLAGIPEVVLHERTGLLCARDDDAAFIAAVERLLDDPALRARMGAAAREHVAANWNPEIWFNRHIDRLIALVMA